jgi:ABC-type transport system involved in cytochrome c biogenesis permease subunit
MGKTANLPSPIAAQKTAKQGRSSRHAPFLEPVKAIAASDTPIRDVLRLVLAFAASLRVTVVLFALAVVVVFFGTMAQIDEGIGTAVQQYFRSLLVWVPIQLLVKFGQIFFGVPKTLSMPGSFPFPGGWLIGGLLLGNLLAAHLVRFKLSWKRSGILILHSGLVILMLSELITGLFATEATMTIHEGENVGFVDVSNKCELALTRSADAGANQVFVIPESILRRGGLIRDEKLPVDVEVVEYMKNSNLTQARQGEVKDVRASNMGLPFLVSARSEESGVDTEQRADAPAVRVTFYKKGTKEPLGTYLLSLWYYPNYTKRWPVSQFPPQEMKADGTTYTVELRPKRIYKPYSLFLEEFRHDKYVGTETPKNFSSQVRLRDPERNVDRTVNISMNSPLRYSHEAEALSEHPLLHNLGLDYMGMVYSGETFYQSSFLADDHGTILSVVRNPGWVLPYISCAMVAVGMLIHFLLNLVGFLRLRYAGSSGTPKAAVAVGSGLNGVARFIPWFGPALAVLFFAIAALPFSDPGEGMYLQEFGKLPVEDGGRYKPIDSLARTSLTMISNRETVSDEKGQNKRTAIEWLLDVMTSQLPGSDGAAEKQKVFRIENDQVLNLLGLKPRPQFLRYSIEEMAPKFKEFEEQISRVKDRDEKHLDVFDQKLLELRRRLERFMELASLRSLRVVPPSSLQTNGEWQSLLDAVSRSRDANEDDPGARAFGSILLTYLKKDAKEFNTALTDYRQQLERRFPEQSQAAAFEAYFNHFDPFYRCLLFYVLLFVVSCVGLATFPQATNRMVFWTMIVVFLLHTWALAARVYISGRPPITNLYSSAIFVGWAGVLLGLAIEAVFKLGIGNLLAAVLGFVGTFFGQYLASVSNGETLEVLQAVLDTNFWLATHVICVNLGYSATGAAGVLGAVFILMNLLRSNLDQNLYQTLAKVLYAVLCFATFLSFTGTVLGGIWADQSWGRFWGWDPKENGALMIVIWNVLILHARWAGLIKQRGMALLAVAGNMFLGWSWIGTNQLGVGLHAYGFNNTMALILTAAWGVHAALLVIGLVTWRGPQKIATVRA